MARANGGIDTLVVALGANNALDAVVSKRVSWSGDGFDRSKPRTPTTCGSRRTSPPSTPSSSAP